MCGRPVADLRRKFFPTSNPPNMFSVVTSRTPYGNFPLDSTVIQLSGSALRERLPPFRLCYLPLSFCFIRARSQVQRQ